MNRLTRYRPSQGRPWTLELAAHLYRRAGFGGTPKELEAAVAAGPDAAVSKLLAGEPEREGDAKTLDYLRTESALPAGASPALLAAWWLRKMASTRHPLRERMTFFWHNHFATSGRKVRNARLMMGHYELLHKHALGDFAELAHSMATDPAMAVWLDLVGSRKGKPNENYARELMELFTLGVGHYTEDDVREAARAFAGWELKDNRLVRVARHVDGGTKTVLGQTGDWGPEDITRLCVEHPACAPFLAGKLYREFVSDAPPPKSSIEAIAACLRESRLRVAPAIEMILRSEEFYSAASVRQKVKSPVDFVLGVVRPVGGSPGMLPLAEALEGLGQLPFAPPSVFGWQGGRAWLTGQTLLARQNLALALLSGEDARFANRCDPTPLVAGQPPREALQTLLGVFLPGQAEVRGRDALDRLARSPGTTPRQLAHAVVCLPDFQLN